MENRVLIYVNDFQYFPGKALAMYLGDFRIKVKQRARTFETSKGKKCVYSPSHSNMSQLSFALKKSIELSILNFDCRFKPLDQNLIMLAEIHLKTNFKGDTDNITKQLKDALQFEKFPVIANDKLIKGEYVEVVCKSDKDSIFFTLFNSPFGDKKVRRFEAMRLIDWNRGIIDLDKFDKI